MSNQPPSDESPSVDPAALLERWQAEGDIDALDALLRREVQVLRSAVRRRAGGMLGGSLASMDVAQEAVMRMLRRERAPSFETRAELHAYLWKTAWRLLVDRLRSRRRDVVRLDAHASQAFADVAQTTGGLSSVEREDDALALSLSMNLLTSEHRQVLELIYLQGLSVAEAAERLGIGVGALKMRLVRARRSLAVRLTDWEQAIVRDSA